MAFAALAGFAAGFCGKLAATFGDDADFAIGNWPADGDERDIRGIFFFAGVVGSGVRCDRNGAARFREARAINAIHARAAAERRERDAERGFRQAVNRRQRLAAETVWREALGETIQRFRQHGFSAIEGSAP